MKYDLFGYDGSFLGSISKLRADMAVKYGYGYIGKNENEIYSVCLDVKEFYRKTKLAKEEESKISNEVKCWKCGKTISTKMFNLRLYCDDCKIKYESEYNEKLEAYLILKAEFMLDRAFKILENQNVPINILEYKECGETIAEYNKENHYSKFDSDYEMVAAMQLLKDKINIKIHPKIATHRADFVLKEEKVVLEIDGFLHEHSLDKDYNIDAKMYKELGREWEVVRIPTNYIENNISALYEAIMEIKLYKQKLRKQNNGIIPEWYSKREKQNMNKLLKIK